MSSPESQPTSESAAEQEYREMIQKVARAIATNRTDDVMPYLGKQYQEKHVEMFVDGNYDKRVDVLLRLMPFVSEDEDFADFEALAEEFAAQIPVGAYEGSSEECDAMLKWMEETQNLTLEQQDTIACQRSRYRAEQMARVNRSAHVRFQELVTIASSLGERLGQDDELKLHLNPIITWSYLKSMKYLDEGERPPVSVLYYADDEEVRTAMFEPEGQKHLERLADLSPCHFSQWQAVTDHNDPEELQEFARGLVELKLLAFS